MTFWKGVEEFEEVPVTVVFMCLFMCVMIRGELHV